MINRLNSKSNNPPSSLLRYAICLKIDLEEYASVEYDVISNTHVLCMFHLDVSECKSMFLWVAFNVMLPCMCRRSRGVVYQTRAEIAPELPYMMTAVVEAPRSGSGGQLRPENLCKISNRKRFIYELRFE